MKSELPVADRLVVYSVTLLKGDGMHVCMLADPHTNIITHRILTGVTLTHAPAHAHRKVKC